jgi:hypothetical protein
VVGVGLLAYQGVVGATATRSLPLLLPAALPSLLPLLLQVLEMVLLRHCCCCLSCRRRWPCQLG